MSLSPWSAVEGSRQGFTLPGDPVQLLLSSGRCGAGRAELGLAAGRANSKEFADGIMVTNRLTLKQRGDPGLAE